MEAPGARISRSDVYGEGIRGLIARGKHLSQVVHFGEQQVFEGATTYTCILQLSRSLQESFQFTQVDDLKQWAQDYRGVCKTFNADALTDQCRRDRLAPRHVAGPVGDGRAGQHGGPA